MTIGIMPHLATELCQVPYRLRKCSFAAVVRSAKMFKDEELLEHMLECEQCREAISKRTPRLPPERRDAILKDAIKSVKRIKKDAGVKH